MIKTFSDQVLFCIDITDKHYDHFNFVRYVVKFSQYHMACDL